MGETKLPGKKCRIIKLDPTFAIQPDVGTVNYTPRDEIIAPNLVVEG